MEYPDDIYIAGEYPEEIYAAIETDTLTNEQCVSHRLSYAHDAYEMAVNYDSRRTLELLLQRRFMPFILPAAYQCKYTALTADQARDVFDTLDLHYITSSAVRDNTVVCHDTFGIIYMGCAILLAVRLNRYECAEILIRHKFKCCDVYDWGKTLMHYAAVYGDPRMIDLIAQHEPSIIRGVDEFGLTPFMHAAVVSEHNNMAHMIRAGMVDPQEILCAAQIARRKNYDDDYAWLLSLYYKGVVLALHDQRSTGMLEQRLFGVILGYT